MTEAPERIWINDKWGAYMRPTYDGDTSGYIRADLVDPAAIREAALREAAVICRSVGFTDHPDSVAYDAEFLILALIDKKPEIPAKD
jgi:hypothetical protein